MTRAISDPDNVDAEFAVLVRSDLKGLGLGRRLLEKLIGYTRDHGLSRLNGITMPNNRGMVTWRGSSVLTLISSWMKALSLCPSA